MNIAGDVIDGGRKMACWFTRKRCTQCSGKIATNGNFRWCTECELICAYSPHRTLITKYNGALFRIVRYDGKEKDFYIGYKDKDISGFTQGQAYKRVMFNQVNGELLEEATKGNE